MSSESEKLTISRPYPFVLPEGVENPCKECIYSSGEITKIAPKLNGWGFLTQYCQEEGMFAKKQYLYTRAFDGKWILSKREVTGDCRGRKLGYKFKK